MKLFPSSTQKLVDYIADFIGITGALIDGQFEWNEDRDAYICDQETYDWWEEVISDNQELDYRIHELAKEHGSDAVHNAICEVGSIDLEGHAATVNRALDEAFGSK